MRSEFKVRGSNSFKLSNMRLEEAEAERKGNHIPIKLFQFRVTHAGWAKVIRREEICIYASLERTSAVNAMRRQ